MNNKLHIVSLGCTKNLVDTEVMLGKLQNFELTDDQEDADVIIVNTCGFIDAAKEESINTILNLHRIRKEDSLLVMAGCLSERYKIRADFTPSISSILWIKRLKPSLMFWSRRYDELSCETKLKSK